MVPAPAQEPSQQFPTQVRHAPPEEPQASLVNPPTHVPFEQHPSLQGCVASQAVVQTPLWQALPGVQSAAVAQLGTGGASHASPDGGAQPHVAAPVETASKAELGIVCASARKAVVQRGSLVAVISQPVPASARNIP
jgi:hypothetical protein